MPSQLSIHAGIAHLAYGIKNQDKQDPFAFDQYDLWFSSDFDFLLDSWVEDTLREIESDITSVDSTNLSEADSRQRSAQSSADRRAQIRAGLLSSDESSCKTGAGSCTGSRISTYSSSKSKSQTSTSSRTISHHHGKHHGGYHETTESRYSGRSWSDDDQSGLSNSEGTSQRTGEASTLSSVSFTIVQYADRYENSSSSAEVKLLTEPNGDKNGMFNDKKKYADRENDDNEFDIGVIHGLEWVGDSDREKIFGTSWFDNLLGGSGDDELYGLEGDDIIYGNEGADRAFGGAGNDVIFLGNGGETGNSDGGRNGDFGSGGSGNDKVYGTDKRDALFGGVGHDYLKGDAGNDHLDGGAGDDHLEAGPGSDKVIGGAGDDLIKAGGGKDDVEAGDGDDVVEAQGGNDDVYGGDGDDKVTGGKGNDDVWGGEGQDILYGNAGSDVLRGQGGDDILVGGDKIDGSYNNQDGTDQSEYIYGGEGSDAIFGQQGVTKQYLVGGAGDDYIKSNAGVTESNLHGGDGNDRIIWNGGGEDGENDFETTVRGGKGDDQIGRDLFYEDATYEQDDNGIRRVPIVQTNDFITGYQTQEALYGEQGDDLMYGGAVYGTQTMHGGSGDDKVVAGINVGNIFLYGNSGSDVVRSDQYTIPRICDGFDDDCDLDHINFDEYLFGDFKYGSDSLDKDLWGDDDRIYGRNIVCTGEECDRNGTQRLYGGDGDDYLKPGNNWTLSRSFGENGNDTFIAPSGTGRTYFKGGDGNDTVEVAAYGDAEESNTIEDFYGDDGDDVLRGSHKIYASALYGGNGQDKVYGGDGTRNYLYGDGGDDWLHGGDNAKAMVIYGDTFLEQTGGDDVIYGGNNGTNGQLLVGGKGDDKIFSGTGMNDPEDSSDDEGINVFGDNYIYQDSEGVEDLQTRKRGADGDGDDLIDIGDSPGYDQGINAYGMGGNDKIIGSIGSEKEFLWGGDGDDKIWAENPGQIETENDSNTLVGGNGADIIYGSIKRDYLHGDWLNDNGAEDFDSDDENDLEGGNDIIYTGVQNDGPGDKVYGGFGDDKLYGQGEARHILYGEYGDDQIWGGDGDDFIWGDDYSEATDRFGSSQPALVEGEDGTFVLADGEVGLAEGQRWSHFDGGLMSGDDTLHGGKGNDQMWAGAGDDYVYGEEDDDLLYGGGGEDTLWGGDGEDQIFTGTGWDTVFGGDGCDRIYSQDGGDVIWGGDCDPNAEDATEQHQWFHINGTGTDPENYTIIMDFWNETAMPHNVLCMYPDLHQGFPASGTCNISPNFGNGSDSDDPDTFESCLTAVDLMSARAPIGGNRDKKRVRGGGCKNDGGPLWVTVDLVENPEGKTFTIQEWTSSESSTSSSSDDDEFWRAVHGLTHGHHGRHGHHGKHGPKGEWGEPDGEWGEPDGEWGMKDGWKLAQTGENRLQTGKHGKKIGGQPGHWKPNAWKAIFNGAHKFFSHGQSFAHLGASAFPGKGEFFMNKHGGIWNASHLGFDVLKFDQCRAGLADTFTCTNGSRNSQKQCRFWACRGDECPENVNTNANGVSFSCTGTECDQWYCPRQNQAQCKPWTNTTETNIAKDCRGDGCVALSNKSGTELQQLTCKAKGCEGFDCVETPCIGQGCRDLSCPAGQSCGKKRCTDVLSCAGWECHGSGCKDKETKTIGLFKKKVVTNWACDVSEGSCDWSCGLGADQNCNPLECFGSDCDELTCKPAGDCGADLAIDVDIDVGVDVDFESNYFVNISVDSSDSSSSSSSSDDEYETEQRPVWGRVFQKKQAKQESRRSRSSRYAQTATVPSEKKSDLEECMALQICTASWYTTESLARPDTSDSSSSSSEEEWTWGNWKKSSPWNEDED